MKKQAIRYLSAALILGLASCEQKQDAALNFYRQVQKEAQLRDEAVRKQLEEMQRGIVALAESVSELKVKRSSQDPDAAEKLADAVSEKVLGRLQVQNAAALAEMKAQLDAVTKSIAAAQVAAAEAPRGTINPPNTVTEPRRAMIPRGEIPMDDDRKRPSDSNKIRIDFGDGR